MSDDPLAREQVIDLLAALYGPHDPDGDLVLWNYVADEHRHAPWADKVKRFAAMVADTAERRRKANDYLDDWAAK